jgi:hypothetical protein
MSGKDSKESDRRWHAVSVKPGDGACNAAISGKNRRWLSREAPLLPLPGCTRPDTCQCTYNHHDDRRMGSRRVEDAETLSPSTRVGNERRARKSRRGTT